MIRRSCGLLVLLVLLSSCQKDEHVMKSTKGSNDMSITVTSSAFSEGDDIPSMYTCDGENVSPPLQWSGIPGNAKSIALIVDDPDAPRGPFTHWVLYNVPKEMKELPEHMHLNAHLSDGSLQGVNDAGKTGYTGPCPPSGTHRYQFTVYALGIKLALAARVHVGELRRAMQGHVLAEGRLTGKYTRK